MKEKLIHSNNTIFVHKNSKDYQDIRNIGLYRQNKSIRSSKYEPNNPQRVNSYQDGHYQLCNNNSHMKKEIRINTRSKISANSLNHNNRPPNNVASEDTGQGAGDRKLVTITTPNSNNSRNGNHSLNNKCLNNYSLLSIVNKEIKNIIDSNKLMKNTINNILNQKKSVL